VVLGGALLWTVRVDVGGARVQTCGARILGSVLAEYTCHYNDHRPHRSLDQRPPNPAPHIVDLNTARVHRRPILGELINEYSQAA
jgi:hypothetical protein